jgi:hypothetical protein
MSMNTLPKVRQSQIAAAYRAGRQQRPGRDNPHAQNHQIPAAPLPAALWHAFEAGRSVAAGKRSDAYTLMRNARFCMTAAVRS